MAVSLPRKLWEHPNPEGTRMGVFRRKLEKTKGVQLPTFDSLYQWSIANRAEFWDFLWRELNIVHEGRYDTVVDESATIETNPPWFKGVRLNFAENILFTAGKEPTHSPSTVTTSGKEDGKIALSEVREGVAEPPRHLTWGELRHRTGQLSQAMKAAGVVKGDRVAVVASNSIDTLVVFLAVTSLGGIFSSSSTDMGVKGILDRLTQIKPKWVFVDDAALYNGKTVDLRGKMNEIVDGMTGVTEFQGLVVQPRFQDRPADVSGTPRAQTLAQFLSKRRSDSLEFERVDYRDPFLIVYSSGTTGQPKCIVHSTGGALTVLTKEIYLHRDLGPKSTILQYTTTGWIMYILNVGALLVGARSVLYDGSPFLPDPTTYIRLLGEQGVTHFGTSPRYLFEVQKRGIRPREVADLSKLEAVISTGMVLADSQFEWFYDEGFPPHVQLSNISGGTDICGSFALENPLSPVYVGGCQGPGLGVPIAAFDQADEGARLVKGRPVQEGEAGELVATAAFPNMPVGFWGDDGQQKRYFDAYFARFAHAWTHGDFIMLHPITKQVIFLGRSDGVLNPSGVRFGSAEIYSVIEDLFSDEVADSLCVGQRRPQDVDENVMLFLLMRPGANLTPDLITRIQKAIREKRSPRHVPRYIFQTPAIPTTLNMKKVETPVKKIVSGRIVKPSGTLANPESLDFYYQFAKVEDLVVPKSKL